MHKVVAVARCQIDISDAAIEGMSGIDREMHRSIKLEITPHRTKILPSGEHLPCFDLKGDNSHHAPPSVPSGNAALDLEMKSNRLAGLETGPALDRIKSRCDGALTTLVVVKKSRESVALPSCRLSRRTKPIQPKLLLTWLGHLCSPISQIRRPLVPPCN